MKPNSPNKPSDAAIEWLVRLQSPELTELEKKQFFAWLNASAANQRAYIEAEQLSKRSQVVRAVCASNEEQVPVRHRFDHIAQQYKAVGHRWYAKATAVACVVMFSAVLYQLWGGWNVTHYHTASGEQRRIVLSDGSKVLLNTDSEVRIQTMRPGQPRLAYVERGEALFDVYPDSDRPFLVETAHGMVRVLGTQFAVHSFQEQTLVTVVEGKVALFDRSVDKRSLDHHKAKATLAANQQLSITEAANGIAAKTVDALQQTSWQQGKLIYNGVAFDDVVADLSRYVDGQIELGVNELKSINVVAVMEISDRSAMVKALQAAFNVRAVQRDEKTTVLYPK